MTAEKLQSLPYTSATVERRELRERPFLLRKGVLTYAAIIMVVFFFLGEMSLQKLVLIHSWSVQQISSSYCTGRDFNNPLQDQGPPLHTLLFANIRGKFLPDTPTVHEAYENKVTFVSNLTSSLEPSKEALAFKTTFEPNRNVFQFGLTVLRNVCMRPDGPIVMVGISAEKILKHVSAVPALEKEWFSSYNCSAEWGCVGFEQLKRIPDDVKWVPGTSTHIIPYLGNVFHHFADRVWPHIAGFQYPLNETIAHPIDHIVVHRFSTWLFQASHNMDRNTFMYQIRILGTLSPEADFLIMDGIEKQDLVCYEKLVLACTTCDRISNKLGDDITKPALLRYRQAAFSYFKIDEPSVPVPPRPLRVAFYGRGDTNRRRVANRDDVAEHLRRYSSPPFDVISVDEILEERRYNQSLPEVVSLFSQVDIFVTVHGANTWAALFMPKHGAVIEIYGPCGPSTWLTTIVNAVDLKHDTVSNPWGERVSSPLAGNTTECNGPLETPDFTVDLDKLDQAIYQLALPSFGFEDNITRHWLHKWLWR